METTTIATHKYLLPQACLKSHAATACYYYWWLALEWGKCSCLLMHVYTSYNAHLRIFPFIGGGTRVHLKVNILANGMQPPSKGESVAII